MLLKQTCRFGTLRDGIPGITDRMLSERLQELENEGVLARTVVPDTPVRVEYSLTRKGKGLAEAVDSLAEWAEKYIPLEPPARKTPRKTARSGKSAVR
jgi:DNA-binding HxlR family transcriptional regulator